MSPSTPTATIVTLTRDTTGDSSTMPPVIEATASATESTSRRFRIYTRTGDKGTTSLYTGERRRKDDLVFEAIGASDELSSHLGLAIAFCQDDHRLTPLISQLTKVQCCLQDANSNVATPASSATPERLEKTKFDVNGGLAKELETWIDRMDDSLPALRHFILPGGGKAASAIHVARSVCRRTERQIVPLVLEKHCDASVGVYINRLSDYLFTAARYAAYLCAQPDMIYKRPVPDN